MAAIWADSASTSTGGYYIDNWAGNSVTTSSGTTATFDSNGGWLYLTTSNMPAVALVAPRPDPTPPRTFNRFLNASDLVEEFIRDLGELGIRQGEILQVPMELFFNWLVVKAAEEDDQADQVADVPKLPARLDTYRRDRCRGCGQFLSKAKRSADIYFCGSVCFDRTSQRLSATTEWEGGHG